MTWALGQRGDLHPSQGRFHSVHIRSPGGCTGTKRPPALVSDQTPLRLPWGPASALPWHSRGSQQSSRSWGGTGLPRQQQHTKPPSRHLQPRARRPLPWDTPGEPRVPPRVRATSVPGQELRRNFPEQQTRQMGADKTDGFQNCGVRGPWLCQPLPRWTASSGQTGGRGEACQNLPEPLSVLHRR